MPYLEHTSSGRLYAYTDALAERADMRRHEGDFAAVLKKKRRVGGTAAAPKKAAEPAPDPTPDAEAALDVVRAEYEEVLGSKPHPNMKADTMRMRIAEARAKAEEEKIMREEIKPANEEALAATLAGLGVLGEDGSEDEAPAANDADYEGGFGFGEG
ncbi:MAG: hypothetical protein ACK5MY_02495 [Jhaorihella sp.]